MTAERVKAHFAGVVEGEVVRYELPNIAALNFVMSQALGGGVTRSLALDAHGKSLSSALLDLDIMPIWPEGNDSRRQRTSSAQADAARPRRRDRLPNLPTLAKLADDLAAGRTSARKLVEECLAKIADPAGEGQRAFIHVDKDAALDARDAMDRLRKANAAPSCFAGIPISIKDLFDIKGQVTRAGSRALEEAPRRRKDAPVVARLRRAGSS